MSLMHVCKQPLCIFDFASYEFICRCPTFRTVLNGEDTANYFVNVLSFWFAEL